MRICITGASGFLGGAIARRLAQEGAEIHALCRPSTDRRQLEDVPITWHQGDITDGESLRGLFRGLDAIVHAAGCLGRAGLPESRYFRINVDGTRNVMAEARATEGRPRVLHLSSPGILGRTGREPAAEGSPVGASNAYERSKAAAEAIVLEYAAMGLPVVVARPGFVYGPGDRHVLGLFRAIQRGRFFYVSGGGHLCQPTFVNDAVGGMLACLRKGVTGHVYHFAGPRAVSFREFGDAIASTLGVRTPRFGMPRWSAMLVASALEAIAAISRTTPPLSRTGVAFFSENRVFSWQKAHRELGYLPQHDLATGVPITVTWYRQHGWL